MAGPGQGLQQLFTQALGQMAPSAGAFNPMGVLQSAEQAGQRDAALTERTNQNAISNKFREQQIGISQEQLGVSQGQLELREKELKVRLLAEVDRRNKEAEKEELLTNAEPESEEWRARAIAAGITVGEIEGIVPEDAEKIYNDAYNQAQGTAAGKAAGTPASLRYESKGPVLDQDNKYVGEMVSPTHYIPTGESSPVPLEKGMRPTTDSALGREQMTGLQFNKLANEVHTTEASLRKLEKYAKSVEGSKQGFGLLADQLIGEYKTILGGNIEDQEMFDAMIAKGQLQGLMGAYKEDVVGGGVLTEKDAERIIERLGGDVNALQNKQVVMQAIKDLYGEKLSTYNEVNVPVYNTQAAYYSSFAPKEQKMVDLDNMFKTGFGEGEVEHEMEYEGKTWTIAPGLDTSVKENWKVKE